MRIEIGEGTLWFDGKRLCRADVGSVASQSLSLRHNKAGSLWARFYSFQAGVTR